MELYIVNIMAYVAFNQVPQCVRNSHLKAVCISCHNLEFFISEKPVKFPAGYHKLIGIISEIKEIAAIFSK